MTEDLGTLPHEADIGVRIGATRERAFEQAALALTAVITDPATVAPREADHPVRGAGRGTVMADWLNALVYEMATRKLRFQPLEVY